MKTLLAVLALSAMILTLPAMASAAPPAQGGSFTIAVIPDTQNYIDYLHQQDQGFPLDARPLFLEQMRFIASHLRSQGGDIDFVTSVGDVWQHQSLAIDRRSAARGYKVGPSTLAQSMHLGPNPAYKDEIAFAIQGFDLLDGKTPFSVAPGNHDYDSMFQNAASVPRDASGPPLTQFTPPEEIARRNGQMMVGGLNNFRSAFGANSHFFKNKSWYIASHDGGGDSAQIFAAGGYKFLHIALQFDPPNASLAWAATVVRQHPGLPTIVTTHDYLNTDGERRSSPALDQHLSDPDANDPQMVWDKFISQHDQIFLVLCGHEHAQAFRTDKNRFGHEVYQILADFQDRQHLLEGKTLRKDMVSGLGDGWLRLMTFDMSKATPIIHVRTYSSHYRSNSTNTEGYAHWYREEEHPQLTDEQFMKADDFGIDLSDFRVRFKPKN